MVKDDDFGFTFVDETEYEEYEKSLKEQLSLHSTEAQTAQGKLTRVMGMIDLFLNNLGSEPEKIYIKWPDRPARIKAFRNRLRAIIEE